MAATGACLAVAAGAWRWGFHGTLTILDLAWAECAGLGHGDADDETMDFDLCYGGKM